MATTLSLDGVERPIRIVRRKGARRVTLSMSRATGIATMTIPPRMPMRDAQAFADQHRGWLAARSAAIPDPLPFTFGMTLPFRGRHLRVERGTGRGLQINDETLHIGATPESLPGKLDRWLKAQARERLHERSTVHAQTLDVTFRRLAIRDTRSRWGSCSSSGTLSYSWRVILAPDAVLDYLAAHEVAHLREMNHGPRFWEHVETLCPDFRNLKHWLGTHGADLHRYGRD